MKTKKTKARVSSNEAPAPLNFSYLSVTKAEAQTICKDTQPFYLASILVQEPDEGKTPRKIIGWISKDGNHAVDAETETRYSSLRVELTVLDYL